MNESKLIWQGFISPEIYSENYSTPLSLKGPITISCNDGMQVLDYILYTTAAGDHYTGSETLSSVLNIILSKLALTFTKIYTSIDLSVAIGEENIMRYLQMTNANYIDEKGVAMSCRQVLDSIFGALGLVIRFIGSNIYIYNPINLHIPYLGKVYNITNDSSYADGEASDDSELGGHLDISEGDIAWYETGSNLDVVPSISEVVVRYDPYTFTEYAYDFNDIINFVPDNFTDQSWQGSEYHYYLCNGVSFNGWTSLFENDTIGVKQFITSEPTYMVKLPDQAYIIPTGDAVLTHTLSSVKITQDDKLKLRFSMQCWIQTRINNMNIYLLDEEVPGPIMRVYRYSIAYGIRIGDQYWKGGNVWEAGKTGSYYRHLIIRGEGITDAQWGTDMTQSRTENTWCTGISDIPIATSDSGVLLQGDVVIEFYTDWSYMLIDSDAGSHGDAIANLYYILMKDLKLEVFNIESNAIIVNEGVEYRGRKNTNLTGKGEFVIETTHGTGIYGMSRGAFMKASNNTIIPGLYRDGDLYDTSNLLIQDFNSQYNAPRFKLSGKLNVVDFLLETCMKLIRDSNHLTGKSFYIVSGTYHDKEESMEVEMIELTAIRESMTGSTIEIPDPTQPPPAPVALDATEISAAHFKANWNYSTGGIMYYLTVATDIDFFSSLSFSKYIDVEINYGTTYDIDEVMAGRTYYYRVRTSNAAGIMSSYSNVITVTTTA